MGKLSLLSENERAFLLGKKKGFQNEKGQLRKRIDNKSERLDIGDLMFDISHLLHEDKINLLVNGLIATMQNKFRHEPNQKIKEEGRLNKPIKNLLKSEDFILRRKIQQDISYIMGDEKRISIFRFAYGDKEFNLKLLSQKFKNSEYTIRQFYERGILIPKGFSKKEFIKLCVNRIKNKDYKTISEKLKLYELYPLELKEKDKNVLLNPIYNYFKVDYSEFKRASSPYYNMQFSLKRLILDDLKNFHKIVN